MTQFVRAANPIWWIPDLTGFPLNDEYYAFFLTNDLPYVFQPVYQDPDGINPWNAPLQFQPAGTLPNNLYFDETKVYRIEIRHGNNSNDQLIYLIEDFVPGNTVTPSNTNLLTAENMITNPQFADIYFTSPFTYTQGSSGSYSFEIGPGWRLDLQGAGSITLTQGALAGTNNEVGNPTYFLKLNAISGWSSVKLVQRFSNNGAIFANGAAALTFTADANVSSQTIVIQYVPSVGVATDLFDAANGPITIGGFNAYGNAVDIPASTNTDPDGSAYVDIVFNIPIGSDLSFTNIQIVGQSTPLPGGFNPLTDAPVYQELTYERIVDHEFHTYKESLLRQPKENLLTGWNFSLNPWQFRTTASSNVASNEYTADQSIIVQQNFVNTATGNNIAVGRGTAAQNYAYAATAVTPTNKFALIQYIDSSTIRPYWGKTLSALVNARIVTTHGTQPKFKMRLLARDTAIPLISQTEPIASWTPGSGSANEPVFALGWQPVGPPIGIFPLNNPEYTLTTVDQNFAFEKFVLPAATSNDMFLAIVIYMTTELDSTATADTVLFNSVSLTHNDFAIEASTETFDETLRKCQFYFETSYNISTDIGTATFNGADQIISPLDYNSGGNDQLPRRSFSLTCKTVKREIIGVSIAKPLFYSAFSGASNSVDLRIDKAGGAIVSTSPTAFIGGWAIVGASKENITFRPLIGGAVISTPTDLNNEGLIFYQYIVDQRLGT